MTLTRGYLFLGCPLSPTGSLGGLTLQVRTGQACGDLAGQFPPPRGHYHFLEKFQQTSKRPDLEEAGSHCLVVGRAPRRGQGVLGLSSSSALI